MTSLSWQKVCSCSFFHHFFMAQINIKAYHSINLFVHSSFFFLPTYCCCFYLKKSGDNFSPKINKSDNGVEAFMMRHWCFYAPALEWVIRSELTLYSHLPNKRACLFIRDILLFQKRKTVWSLPF